MSDSPKFDGAELVFDRFGYWPSFHDAEIHWIRLDRLGTADLQGPTVEMLVHAFEITSEVAPEGHHVLQKHSLIHFRFEQVSNLNLDEFNHQNAIFGLSITDETGTGWENKFFRVGIDSSYGVGGSFNCVRPEVVAVTECNGAGQIETPHQP